MCINEDGIVLVYSNQTFLDSRAWQAKNTLQSQVYLDNKKLLGSNLSLSKLNSFQVCSRLANNQACISSIQNYHWLVVMN